jgi:hypothetical protein
MCRDIEPRTLGRDKVKQFQITASQRSMFRRQPAPMSTYP